jgi:hypothetical protein
MNATDLKNALQILSQPPKQLLTTRGAKRRGLKMLAAQRVAWAALQHLPELLDHCEDLQYGAGEAERDRALLGIASTLRKLEALQ